MRDRDLWVIRSAVWQEVIFLLRYYFSPLLHDHHSTYNYLSWSTYGHLSCPFISVSPYFIALLICFIILGQMLSRHLKLCNGFLKGDFKYGFHWFIHNRSSLIKFDMNINCVFEYICWYLSPKKKLDRSHFTPIIVCSIFNKNLCF